MSATSLKALTIVALAAAAMATSAQAAVLYDANTTTGSIGSFVGDPDALQVVTFASGGRSVKVNTFTVLGVNYGSVPTAATGLRIRFYDLTSSAITAASTNTATAAALLGASPLSTLDFTLSAVTAAGSYNYTLGSVASPLNTNVPATVGVRVTFFTDSTFTTETDGVSLSRGRYSTGLPSIGTAQPFSFSDDNGDNAFTADESFVGQASPLVPLNIRMAIDATVLPEPVTFAAIAPAAMLLRRRRRA